MAVLGGIGRWQGAVVGAVIVAWVPSLLGEFGDYQVVVNGILIMILVVFAPDGVTGLIERGWRRLRRTRSRSTDHPVPLPAEAPPVPATEAGKGSL
jgi:branched-chain amino acid transport system permease protein